MHKTDQHKIDPHRLRKLAEFALDDASAAEGADVSPSPTDHPDALISMYAPMQMAGREVKQNVIRWKNVIKEAKQALAEYGLDEKAIDDRLQAAEQMLDDEQFWQHQSHGLAVFISMDETEVFQLPESFEQTIVVGSRFYLRPLLNVVQSRNNYHILAVSANRVRLLRTDGQHEVQELDPDTLPANLVDALNIDEYVSALQIHTSSHSQASQGRQPAIHHGHGGSGQEVRKKDELLQFFQCLSRALDDYFKDDETPLIFAGVDYLFPIFRSTFSRPQLCETPIVGNPDDWSAEILKEKAQAVIEELHEEACRELVGTYQEKAFTDWASSEPREIAAAANLGQVELLLLSDSTDENGKGSNSPSSRADSPTNRAIVQTLCNGGTTVSIPAGMMPDNASMAAVFRSPASRFVDAENTK